MNRHCKNCSVLYYLPETDLHFYQKLEVPPPSFCPACRFQRRLAWRNERYLYHSTCAATRKPIISVFAPDEPIVVYDNSYWFSDGWSPLDYGRDFDFSRPFFQQFNELMRVVPQLARSASNNENSDYVNQAGNCKNCYLVFEAVGNEDCLYGNNLYSCRSCLDVLQTDNCELCYQIVNCENCYNLSFSEDCQGCSESQFLKSCIGCSNCFQSVNLRNKRYYFRNQELSSDDYNTQLARVARTTINDFEILKREFQQRSKSAPTNWIHGIQNENSSGDYLWNTRNCKDCFDLRVAEDCAYVTYSANMKMVYDVTVFGGKQGAEFCYESHCIGEGAYNVLFSDQVWNACSDIYYSKLCTGGCKRLFGCVGMRKQNNCVLNKQYTVHEYERLFRKIKEHMQQSGEWGEYFPISLSPHAYNETEANHHFPLSKQQALEKGYRWREANRHEYQAQRYSVPERVTEVSDEILQQILACSACRKNYKLIKQELGFYRHNNLPIPRLCHECRHRHRMRQKNKFQTGMRSCSNCRLPLQTSYAPDPELQIYCEDCYRAVVQ